MIGEAERKTGRDNFADVKISVQYILYNRDDPLLLKVKGNRIYVFTSSHSINSLLFFKFSRTTLHTGIPKLRAQVSVRKLDLNHS